MKEVPLLSHRPPTPTTTITSQFLAGNLNLKHKMQIMQNVCPTFSPKHKIFAPTKMQIVSALNPSFQRTCLFISQHKQWIFYWILYTQEDNVLNFQKKEQMTKYGQRRLGIKGEVEKAIISHVTGPK